MATYAKEKGFTVQTLSTDPVASQAAGGSWASGGNTNSNHSGYGGSSGTYNAALVASNEPYGANVELYDGSSWTETGNLNTSRTGAFSAGTQPATWLGGGRTGPSGSTNNTETFNGSSWTEVNEMNTTRFSSGSTGTYTAGIAVAGNTFTDVSRAVETWNGTTWSTHPNDYDADVADIITFGTTTAAIMAGGFDGPAPRGGNNASVTTAYSYDGSTYTSITALPQTLNGATGTGSQTDAIAAGGNRYPAPNTANTVAWNGTSWSQVQDVPIAAYAYGGSKATTSTENQLAFCGQPSPPGAATSTFEWTAPSTFSQLNLGEVYFNTTSGALKVIQQSVSDGAWASGGALNTARRLAGGIGTQTANLFVGGELPSGRSDANESYNGTSWTELNNINTTRGSESSFGTQTAGIIAGGETPPGASTANTESWNGSNWTEVNNLNQTRRGLTNSGAGTQTAGLTIGGFNPPSSTLGNTESWDGTSFTEVNDMNTARQALAAHGTQTDALAAAGYTTTQVNNVETWNGTSWTEVAEVNTTRNKLGGAGTSTDFLAYGGQTPAPAVANNTEYWNGSSWTELNDMATSRSVGGDSGSGSGVLALASGGSTDASPPGITTATEEWTAPLAVKTVTVG